jgi:hypothetical protein
MKLSPSIKILLVVFCFAIAIIGFMIKLPSSFRHHDKELHALFYFMAAAFLNILFAKRNILIHSAIFAFLYLFGMAIEYSQEYSNKVFHNRIHGRYDIEDVNANLKGLIIFSILWIAYLLIFSIYKKVKPENAN